MALFKYLYYPWCIIWFAIKTAFAFCVITGFLWIVGTIDKGWYEEITYWANQKSAPTIEGCEFELLPNFSSFPEDKKYNYYSVTIKTNIEGRIGSVLISPKVEYMLMINKKESQPYLVIWKDHIIGTLPKVEVRTENKFFHYSEKKSFNKYECPLRVELIFDE